MMALASSLARYVEQHFEMSLQQGMGDPVRPVLVGPPTDALQALFNLLTASSQHSWTITRNGTAHDVAVLLVDGQSSVVTNTGCQLVTTCHWDYAVTVRNSHPHVLVLADVAAWDNRPESLANTTETLGAPRPTFKGDGSSLWHHLLRDISTTKGVDTRDVQVVLQEILDNAVGLEPSLRDRDIWTVVDRMLGTTPPVLRGLDVLCWAAGLSPVLTANLAITDSVSTLHGLAAFLDENGLRDGFDRLKLTAVAQAQQLGNDLDDMCNWIAGQVSSAAAFAASPSRFIRTDTPIPSWYTRLHAGSLRQMLDELQQGRPQQKINVLCDNPVMGPGQLPGGPWVVASAPCIRAFAPRGGHLGTPTFGRRVDRTPVVGIPAEATDSSRCTEASPPRHRKPIRYSVNSPGYREGTIDVVVLDTFEAGGLVCVRDAVRNPAPTNRVNSQSWNQALVLARGGATELCVYHSSTTAEVELKADSEPPRRQPTVAGQCHVDFTFDLEHDDVIQVALYDSAGATVGSWDLQVTVQEEAREVARSRLEALINEHRSRSGRQYLPRAVDSLLQRIERACYVSQADSWKPVFACWSGAIVGIQQINWADPRLGNVRPQIDPRPVVSPPASVLAAREAVRAMLAATQRPVAEITMDDPAMESLAFDYVNAYLGWLKANPREASWFDVIALHSADWNQQAAHHVASEEPVFLLLSPLHPLRVAWHVVAQGQLQESLGNRCPAAGLLDPSTCPDCGALYLWNGQSVVPRAFLSIACDNPHWAVLLNANYLDRETEGMRRLTELGLSIQGITAGFSEQQTLDGLQEVHKLLPARSVLRVGVVGDPETSNACGDGVIGWCEGRFMPDQGITFGCSSVEVYDTRGSESPSPEQLAAISESTGESVRWYRLPRDAGFPRLDLTIIDQLGVRSPVASDGGTRSTVSPSALYRVRIREDYQNALTLSESRVGVTTAAGLSLPEMLAQAVVEYESGVANDAGRTHFRFRPNQDAIGRRLQASTFLAVTSSQIDPACVVRGTVGQGGYLWDYELPGVLGGSKNNLGYYLVASPTDAMCRAVQLSASLVTNAQVDSRQLLDEISRHGIPVLKRLASGGSQSRGELGLLLAVRLIQDAFRQGTAMPRLPVWSSRCVHLVLPVDPYEELFDEIRARLSSGAQSSRRPDLLVVAIDLGDGTAPISIKLTPVEVKFRGNNMSPGDMREALGQARNLGEVASAIWTSALPTTLWETCSTALLAQILDFGFRIYASPQVHGHTEAEWAGIHQAVLQQVLDRRARVTVNTAGRLLVFDASAQSQVADLDGDRRLDTAVISVADSGVLLSGAGALSATADNAVSAMDFSFPTCTCAVGSRAQATAPSTNAEPVVPAAPTAPVTSTEADATPASVPSEPTPAAIEEATELAPGTRGGSRVPPEVRQQVREAFQGFIGNEPAVARLSNDLLRALIEQPPHLSRNYLFTGLPSTGKTELARRMASALRLPFIKLDGRGVTSRDRLFEMVNGELQNHGIAPSQVGNQVGLPVMEYPPLIIFIDEVHLVSRGLQESLLTMLETADRTVVLSDHVARVQRATFLFATTRVSDVDAAFASRCDEIQLREYTEEQVAEILQWKAPHGWPREVYLALARLGRCVPRVAIQLAQSLETAILVSEREQEVLQHLDEVRRAREIDEKGLTRMDFEYLSLLEKSNRPIGEQVVLNTMRTVDKDRILNEVEPFLVRLGFIRHGPQGREITQDGREYVLAKRLGR